MRVVFSRADPFSLPGERAFSPVAIPFISLRDRAKLTTEDKTDLSDTACGRARLLAGRMAWLVLIHGTGQRVSAEGSRYRP